MKRWGKFSTLKERGEWVELQFMAAAASRGYHVLKPWGDSSAYDVGIDHDGGLLRVQVKSSSVRSGTGYFCRFRRNYLAKRPYTLDELDLFATYVIPVNAWYLIPASVILGPTRKVGVMLFPVDHLKKNRYRYESYKEAWPLLTETRRSLTRRGRPR
jgi:hypothetical protein